MNTSRVTFLWLTAIILGADSLRAGAGDVWQWTHQASGSATANVFDGGPPVFREGETDGPDDATFLFRAHDDTAGIETGT